MEQLDQKDLDEFRIEKAKLMSTFASLEHTISDHHFALREKDIQVAQVYVTAIADLHESALGFSAHNIQNFESQLLNFLRNPDLAVERFPPEFFEGTRFEHWRASGSAAEQNLRDKYMQIASSRASSLVLRSTLKD